MKRAMLGMAAIAALTLVPQAASAQSAAELTLVHGIPGVVADVAVDGTVVIDDFVPGSLANISSFAGQTLTNLTVTDDDSGEVIIGPIASLEIPDSGNHSLVAHLDEAGDATITTFENNTDPLGDGEARLTLRHTAEAPAIDLIIGDQRPITNLANTESAELDLPDGDLTDASVAPTGDVAVEDLAPLDLAANTDTIVYVVGSAPADTLDFVVQVITLETQVATTTTTTGASSTTTSQVPTQVNTGSPLDGTSNTTLIVVALAGVALAGGAMVARRHT